MLVFEIICKLFESNTLCYDADFAIEDSILRRFFLDVKLSWPLSVLDSLSLSLSLELDEELELLELSDAIPVLCSNFTSFAIFARSGSFSCLKLIENILDSV